MTKCAGNHPCVLITGATGFLGHYVLAELLRRRVRCAVLLRPAVSKSLDRLSELLADVGMSAGELVDSRWLVPLEGSLPHDLPEARSLHLSGVIHTAASTRFDADITGEPVHTNVAGTRHLLEWADDHGIRSFHLVSSAYQCGRVGRPVPEAVLTEPPEVHNTYEQTKWESERLSVDWAGRGDHLLTIYRPSVIVGAYRNGRSTKFSGFYLPARATDILSRAFEGAPHSERWSIPLRLHGRPDGVQNIVPVDYVAAMIAAVYCNPADHGGVYHLTHPTPPTNQQIKNAIEGCFQIGGSRWVDEQEFRSTSLNEYEKAFFEVSRPVEHYFIDTPDFERSRTACVEQRTGIACELYDQRSLTRLIRYANDCQWGRKNIGVACDTAGDDDDSPCALYYERFLPEHVGRSQIAQATRISVTVRFIIEDVPNGQWVCRFEHGQLAEVHRGTNTLCEQITYRTTQGVFWRSITGRVHPQELFLSGEAHVTGDVEQGLKLAMILHAFTREFPCDRLALQEMEAVHAR